MVRRFECWFMLAVMLFPSGLVSRKAVKFLISLASMFLPSWIDNTDYRVQWRGFLKQAEQSSKTLALWLQCYGRKQSNQNDGIPQQTAL